MGSRIVLVLVHTCTLYTHDVYMKMKVNSAYLPLSRLDHVSGDGKMKERTLPTSIGQWNEVPFPGTNSLSRHRQNIRGTLFFHKVTLFFRDDFVSLKREEKKS